MAAVVRLARSNDKLEKHLGLFVGLCLGISVIGGVCLQNSSKGYGRILMKLSGHILTMAQGTYDSFW